jgi:hypothetical protein
MVKAGVNYEPGKRLMFANIIWGSVQGVLASIPCILWIYLMGFISINGCGDGNTCPPSLLIRWLVLGWVHIGGIPIGPLIYSILVGIGAGLIGGFTFHFRYRIEDNARLGGSFGTLLGIGFFAFALSILFFINEREIITKIIVSGISLLYLIVIILIASNYYRRSGTL